MSIETIVSSIETEFSNLLPSRGLVHAVTLGSKVKGQRLIGIGAFAPFCYDVAPPPCAKHNAEEYRMTFVENRCTAYGPSRRHPRCTLKSKE